jgi:hypothetical protein
MFACRCVPLRSVWRCTQWPQFLTKRTCKYYATVWARSVSNCVRISPHRCSVQCNVKKHLLKAQVWPDRWHLEKRWFSLSAYTRAHRQALEAAHRFIQQKHSGCGSKYLTCRCKYNPVLFSVVEGCQELSFRVYIKQFLKHHIHGQR